MGLDKISIEVLLARNAQLKSKIEQAIENSEDVEQYKAEILALLADLTSDPVTDFYLAEAVTDMCSYWTFFLIEELQHYDGPRLPIFDISEELVSA